MRLASSPAITLLQMDPGDLPAKTPRLHSFGAALFLPHGGHWGCPTPLQQARATRGARDAVKLPLRSKLDAFIIKCLVHAYIFDLPHYS